MEYANYLGRAKETPVVTHAAWGEALRTLVLLMAPPFHIWQKSCGSAGGPYSVHRQAWPHLGRRAGCRRTAHHRGAGERQTARQIPGPADIAEAEAKAHALACEGAQRHMDGKRPVKVIYIPGKLVNIVVK